VNLRDAALRLLHTHSCSLRFARVFSNRLCSLRVVAEYPPAAAPVRLTSNSVKAPPMAGKGAKELDAEILGQFSAFRWLA